jgi:hypothetical protein
VAEEKTGLVLTQRTGQMKLFIHEIDDLHQWDFLWNLRLREFLRVIACEQQEWKRRALEAEEKLVQAAGNVSNTRPGQNAGDVRYAALRRYLAKQLHPDFAPGNGIEKIVRCEIFKEIWVEIERLNRQAAPPSTVSA